MRTALSLVAGAITAVVLLSGGAAGTAAAPSAEHGGSILALSQEKWP